MHRIAENAFLSPKDSRVPIYTPGWNEASVRVRCFTQEYSESVPRPREHPHVFMCAQTYCMISNPLSYHVSLV